MKSCGLYLHIPFCRSKCIYCDFFSGGVSVADWDRLIGALLQELNARKDEIGNVADTLYIGGGTPSLMPAKAFARMIDGINEIMGSENRWQEATIEVNPDDVTEEKCILWKKYGINRVSMGVQSFVDSELKNIRRRHDGKCAYEAFGTLKAFFDNISIDLMFGLPGQTVGSWNESISKALEVAPGHISAYSLMFEDGTPISVLKKNCRLKFPSDDECVDMWKILSSRLTKAGYNQYEISNYSKRGFESLHNSRYWLGNPYLGIGPSAHSYDGCNVRRANPADLKGYLDHFSSINCGTQNFYTEERLGSEELKEEMILTRMRMAQGLSLSEFEERFGLNEKNRLLRNADKYVKDDMLIMDGGRLKLSDSGIMIADEVILGLSM